ncbi:chemotaxis protein CheD [Bremerella cremea]|uniref:Probable chemoreceptor glutamine deamidase CheD n=1 Tax=Blastopirellula marina TaxID=124 RepID=A0A2S8FIP5_9BACT|nr:MULTISPECIES: chemotaxis protein CheD [Pirellulaceae]PQO32069.1 chemotaxis protein CheD [Blastopirellula marina]RCS45135.1 chemotaxis protein CheD [Bremerella cremea]
MATANLKRASIRVPMAGIEAACSPDALETLLGSCVGIALWCRETQHGALAHAMLSECRGDTKQPGRFVDSAIPTMLDTLAKRGARRRAFVAKICGGSNMFKGIANSQDVGKRNIEKAKELLRQLNIPILAEHVGGNSGRVITFDLESGRIQVKVGRETVAEI